MTDAVTLRAEGSATISTSGDTIIINASGGIGESGWSLTGNTGTTAANFLGTTDDVPLELRVNNQRAMRIEPDAISPNIIGGNSSNRVTNGVEGATISGGGLSSNQGNRVTDGWGTVGGGMNNQAGDNAGTTDDAQFATVGGGLSNTASGLTATIAGGISNEASGLESTVSGGNTNTASGDFSTVIGGGSDHFAFPSVASGKYATVAGGERNTAAGDYSFAAGRRAKANHDGAFVWADTIETEFASTAPNQFLIHAEGGVGIGTSTPGEMLTVAGAIESISGGFKFPDGSVQTAAASGAGDGHSLDAADGSPADALFIDTDSNVGIGTTTPDNLHKLEVRTSGSANFATAVFGKASAASGITVGVYGQADSPSGRGVYGVGGASGVFGATDGTTGAAAILGIALASSGITYGVTGTTFSPGGVGVRAVSRISYATNPTARILDALSGSATRFLVQANGNVGIGTTSPGGTLHVSGEGIITERNGSPFIRFLDSKAGNKTWVLQSNAPADRYFRIRNESDNVDAILIDTDGSIGIGMLPPLSTQFGVNGNAAFTGKLAVGLSGAALAQNILTVAQNSATDPIADDWKTYSSRRWKTNIKPIESAMEKVKRLRGVSFNWKADGKHDIGLIAEEVGEVIPEIVEYEENGRDAKSLGYSRLVAVLIEAVKEQQKEIEKLKNVVKSLKHEKFEASNWRDKKWTP